MGYLRIFNCFGLRRDSSASQADTTVSLGSSTGISADDLYSAKGATTAVTIEPAKSGVLPCTGAATHHAALVVTSKGRYEVVHLPSLGVEDEDDVLIEVHAAGLNPIDWKSVDHNFCLPEFPWVTGREASGVVKAVGGGVTDVAVGNRVWTSTYYKKREAGCFQNRIIVPKHTVLTMPSSVSFESAACLGVPGLTAAMTLWHWLQVPMPSSSIAPVSAATADTAENHLLIWGGSTITGQFAIQLAAYCGLTVIAVVSAKNAGLMSSLGAHHIILRDGQSNEDIVAAVRSITGDTLTKAIDIVGPKTAVCAMQALSHSRPAQLAPLNFLLPGQEVPVNVTVKNIEMKTFILDKSSRQYAVELNRLVREGKVKFPQLELLPGGLEAIPVGLERQKRGDMDGRKLIVSLR